MKKVIGNLYTRKGGSAQERISEVKRILGLGTAAYTAVTAYVTHALATAANDFIVASGNGAFVKKTLAETKAILGLMNYTAQESLPAGESESTISVATYCSLINTDSAGDDFILPSGTITGQLKKLIFHTDGGDSIGDGYADVYGNFEGENGKLTFDSSGQYVLLQWNGAEWIAIEYGNTVEPGNDPTFAS